VSERQHRDSARHAEADNPVLIGRVADTTAQRDRGALDTSVTRLLFEYLGARDVTLYRLIEDGGCSRLARRASIVVGEDQPDDDTVSDLTTLPRASDDPAWMQCVTSRDLVQIEREPGTQTSLFPIEDNGAIVGLLEVAADETMPPRDTQLVCGMLRILKNQLALLDYGERDTLTGLLNRKTFEGRIQKLSYSGKLAWLGLVDIDHFKNINDQYGHLVGDEVLLLVAQIMGQTFRGADQLFRFGGEEFVILLEGIDKTGAGIAFDRLRGAVENYRFPQGIPVTISLGYTRIIANDLPACCTERADAALYFAKRNGRNNVREYESLIESGALVHTPKEGAIELF